jgi:cytochrome c biogenesis protein CcdA
MKTGFLVIALTAGVLTVLSPCILPFLPALLSASASDGFRHRPFWIVLGLAISFTSFGAVFAVFGTFQGLSNEMLRDIALAFLLFFGISLLWPRLWDRIGARVSVLAQGIPGADRPAIPRTKSTGTAASQSLGCTRRSSLSKKAKRT